MSVPLWILGVVVMLGVVALVAQWRRQAELSRRLENEMADARDRATEVARESKARVKRIERESSRELERAEHRLLKDLLPLLDALDAASAVRAEAERGSAEAVQEGLLMVTRELEDVFEKHGVRRVAPSEGDAFDPQIHEAVEVRETDEIEDGAIAQCHRAGYAQGEDLLRQAMVAVARSVELNTEDDSDVAAPQDEAEEVAPNPELTDQPIESNLAATQPVEQK